MAYKKSICFFLGNMADSRNLPLMTIEESKTFFIEAGILESDAATYAENFQENNMRESLLANLDKNHLSDMGITKCGDVLLILQHIKKKKHLVAGTSTEIRSKSPNNHAIGSPSFEEVRRGKYFIDKTLLIKQIIERPEAVFLITLPPRFGKSVNLDMVRRFFEVIVTDPQSDISSTLFDGTGISGEQEIIRNHFRRYPIIYLNLAGMFSSYENAFSSLWEKVFCEFYYHNYLLSSEKLTDGDKSLYSEFCQHCPDLNPSVQAKLENSLLYLSEFLFKHHNEKCVILVDEFDAPVTNAMFTVSSNELLEIIKLRDVILGNVVKNTKVVNYKFAILTGVADIICTIASPLRGLSRFQFLQNSVFSQFYGICESEFQKLTEYTDQETKNLMKQFYSGYRFNEINMYNTWSIVKSLTMNVVQPFWTEETNIILKFRTLLREGRFLNMIKKLVAGERIAYTIDLKTVLCVEDLTTIADCCVHKKEIPDIDVILVFLFQNGYLVKNYLDKKLEVPNNEVRKALEGLCWNFVRLDCNIRSSKINECIQCFPQIENCLENSFEIRTFCNTFQYLCESYNQNFVFNHHVLHSLIFIIALKTDIPWSIVGAECPIGEHYVGSTRSDVVLFINNFLIIIEVKYKQDIDVAMKQIYDRDYLQIVKNKNIFISFSENEIKHYICYGIAVSETRRVTMKLDILDKNKRILKSVM